MILSSLNTSLNPNIEIFDSDAAPVSTQIEEDTMYPLEAELLYHVVENMFSTNVLKNELNVCDDIIQYKSDKGYDKVPWEEKRKKITQLIENLSSVKETNEENYKENIIIEIDYEKGMIETMTENKEDISYKRIMRRIEILEEELKEIENKENNKISNEQQKSNRDIIKIKKEEIKKSPLYQLILKRVIEYKSAIDYFKENNLPLQKKKAIEDATKIIQIMKHIKETNNVDNINESDIPKEITPEYICGYSQKERLERYRTILLRLLKEKEQISKNVCGPNSSLDIQRKKTLTNYDKLINILSEYAKNVWVPAPLYKIVKKTIESIINKDIPEGTLILTIGNITYDKQNIYLLITVKNGKLSKSVKVFPISGNNFNNKQIKFDFSSVEYKTIYNGVISIELYHKKFMCSNIKGECTIKLNSLQTKSQIDAICNIELLSKRNTPTIDITIKIRKALSSPETAITQELFIVTKIFKPFK